MARLTKTPNGRVRVRARRTRDTTALQEGSKKSRALAPRLPNGRIVPGYRFKEILAAHERAGLKPHLYDEDKITNKPMFVKDPSIERKLVKYIKRGYAYTTVCRLVGIDRDTFIKWLVKGKEGHPLYYPFYKKIAKAEAKGEIAIFEELRKHGKYEWKVNAWMLERRWPEHYARQDRNRAEIQIKGEISVRHKEDLGKMVIEDTSARELARRILDSENANQIRQIAEDADFEEIEEEV